MRSFVGILRNDGASPDEGLLHNLATTLRLSTSTQPEIAIDGECGLAVVSHVDETNLIPRVGAARIAGELRLDDRPTLQRKLNASATANDFELVLLAWRRWRGDCAAHLFGDFAFAIWDGETRELFCARDRFGVRPLYLAQLDNALLFSDSLEAILAHPDVDAATLDDRAVADYLEGGLSNDAAATIYANVRRLPPAHALLHGKVQRYWTLQIPDQHRSQRDAPARLEAALKDAVADRVTGSTAIVFMSGGLDSTALAAIAREVKPETRLLAGTSVYRTRTADVEESFAAEAARSIGIPIEFFALDEWSPLRSLESGIWTPEPGPLLTAAMTRDIYARAAAHAPLALHGHPADAVLFADLHHSSRDLLRHGHPIAFASALIDYMRVRRRPPWFVVRPRPRPPMHPLQSSSWASYFEWAHPLLTRATIELVYPWCDLRVIDAALAMPPFPWLVDKHVVRELLRGRVSEVIRTRPKTFASGSDPWTVPATDALISIDLAAPYVDRQHFADTIRTDGFLRDKTLRAVALEWWLRERQRAIRELRGRHG